MTPFGLRLRQLRAKRGITQATMAHKLHLSPAYLSALENGHRGQPNLRLVHQICQLFHLIWDEADEMRELAGHSNPRPSLNSAGLSATHTLFANVIAQRLDKISEAQAREWLEQLDKSKLKWLENKESHAL